MRAIAATLICFSTTWAVADAPKSGAITMEETEKLFASTKPGTEVEIRTGIFVTGYRIQAKAALRGGWHRARATNGNFTVEMPVPFNDVMVRTKATDGVEIRVDLLAGSAGTVKWGVSCTRRKDGTLGPTKVSIPDKTESVGNPVRGWVRTVSVQGRICSLSVETRGEDPLPDEAVVKRFLTSLKVAGKPSWK